MLAAMGVKIKENDFNQSQFARGRAEKEGKVHSVFE